ncbi:MAG: glutathione metabolism protein, partial [Aquabacterium sp.]
MTIANTAVLIAAVMPALTMGMAKAASAGKKRSQGGYDNNDPRAWAG